MSNEMEYLNLCYKTMAKGSDKSDRTGTGTRSIFGHQMRFDLNKGFPILTTKRVPFRIAVSELLWFIKGDTNIRYLLEHNNNIWNEWAFKKWVESDEYEGPDMTDFGLRANSDPVFEAEYLEVMERFKGLVLTDDAFAEKYGDLGNVYGKQWRDWTTADGESIDQLKNAIDTIKNNPDSRRIIVNAWNVEDVESGSMALPPCHTMFQFYVNDGKLSAQLYQRSGDIFLGIPVNIVSYSLLIHLIAKECGLGVGEFVHTIGDAHIYNNHFAQVEEMLNRDIKDLPELKLDYDKSIFDLDVDDIELVGYDPHPTIKGDVSV